MTILSLIYAPDPIFKKKAAPVAVVDDKVRKLADDMLESLQAYHAVGMGANMVGVLKRVAVVDLNENDQPNPYIFINPEIIWRSSEVQTFEEASICFPGISANVTRPSSIKVKYLDRNGKEQELTADGFFAAVIQHEIDYLDGKIFLDYVSKMKRDILLKKLQKYGHLYKPHVHGEHCDH